MAYMNQEKKAIINAALDKVLKARGFKYSLRVDNHMSIVCTIQSGPVEFIGNFKDKNGDKFVNLPARELNNLQVNLYWLEDHFSGQTLEILKECSQALRAAGYYDRSDAMTDYFDTAYYMHLNIGAWDKPYKITAATKSQNEAWEKAIKAKILSQGCDIKFIDKHLIIKAITV
jgi:hypothetical protein